MLCGIVSESHDTAHNAGVPIQSLAPPSASFARIFAAM